MLFENQTIKYEWIGGWKFNKLWIYKRRLEGADEVMKQRASTTALSWHPVPGATMKVTLGGAASEQFPHIDSKALQSGRWIRTKLNFCCLLIDTLAQLRKKIPIFFRQRRRSASRLNLIPQHCNCSISTSSSNRF